MTKKRPKVDRHSFYSQFHNLDKHHDSAEHNPPKWYNLPEPPPHAKKPVNFRSIHKAQGR